MGNSISKQTAAAAPDGSIPKLPPRLNSLLNMTGTWNEEMGSLEGWNPPTLVAPSWTPILKSWIDRLEEALAPMSRVQPTTVALVRLQARLPHRTADKTQYRLLLEAMLADVRRYPESVVLEEIAHAERHLKWWPAPKELLDPIEDEMRGPRDELVRLRALLRIAETAAIPSQARGKSWDEMTDAEKAAHEAMMAPLRAEAAAAAKPRPPPVKPMRKYTVPDEQTPEALVGCWLEGWGARGDGAAHTDCQYPDGSFGQRLAWEGGWMARAGWACGGVELEPWLAGRLGVAMKWGPEAEPTSEQRAHN